MTRRMRSWNRTSDTKLEKGDPSAHFNCFRLSWRRSTALWGIIRGQESPGSGATRALVMGGGGKLAIEGPPGRVGSSHKMKTSRFRPLLSRSLPWALFSLGWAP